MSQASKNGQQPRRRGEPPRELPKGRGSLSLKSGASRSPEDGGRRRDNAPRLDAANLAGITTLMNPQHIKAGVNLEDAEKTVMGKSGGARKPDIDPVRLYTSELNQLAEELGIDLLDDADPLDKPSALAPRRPALAGGAPPKRVSFAPGVTPGSRPGAPRSPALASGRIDALIDALDLDGSDSGGSDSGGSDSGDSGGSDSGGSDSGGDSGDGSCDCDDDCDDECSCDCHAEESCDCDDECDDECSCDCHAEGSSGGSESEGDDGKVDSIIARLESDLGIKTDGKRERRRNRLREVEAPQFERARSRGGHATNEQERRRHINSVVADLRGETRTTYGVERERIQDIKASKLEQIGQLRMTLEEEGIDCTSVTAPTSESPMEEIDSVLNILRLKNDRNRYSSLAEEVILGFAEGIETVFDGTRSVPLLGWRPDYTGYNATINCKLHRMRFETSQVVGHIIEKYNIGPTARIVMELLPSFFLYPRQQRKQRGSPGLASDPHVADARHAYATINDSDRPKNLDDVRNI